MRIGFFTDTYLPSIHGVEISIETFRKSLEKMGHKVFIYAPHAPGYRDKNPNVFRFQSIKVIRKPEMRLAFPFWLKNRIGEITDFKLDIAHSHTPFSMGLLAKYITDYQKIPLVYTHHTHYPEYAKFYLKEKVITPSLARFFSGWYANLADAVIAPSYKMKGVLREYGVKKNRPIYILPTGINLQIFRKSKEVGLNFRKKLHISPEAKILLFIGRMGKEKNPGFLLKTLKETLNKTESIILLMIGDGPFLKGLQKMARRMKIDEKIIFRGSVSHEEIPFYYQASDIFVFSSLTDTQGIVILEALACGLPVVALKDDAFEGMVIDNENGFLVKEFLPEIFAERVLEILDDSVIYQSFSDNSRKIAHNFSEENQAKKLLNIYKSLI